MRSVRSRFSLPLLSPKFWIFLHYHIDSAFGQCATGLEATCVWHHSVNSALRWQQKTESGDPYVELSECHWPDSCGIGQIESPWLPARDAETRATLHYRIYGTSSVYLRLHLRLEDDVTPHQLLSKTGNYAYGYPTEWTAQDVRIPPTHTNHQLLIKAYVPYAEAMVAVKGITLDRNLVLTINPTPYLSDIEEYDYSVPEYQTPDSDETENSTPGTRNDVDYFPDDDDDEEMERRFQALEVQNFIGEEDLTKGFTTVVKPQLCMYR